MSEIINVQTLDGKLLVSSREVAINFEKQHKHVIEAIEEIRKGVAEKSADLFIESKYQHIQNKQWYKEYLMDKKGFSLLAMGFNGKKALEWKLKYIEAFEFMEKEIIRRKTLSPMEQLKLQYQVLEDHEQRFERQEQKIEKIEDKLDDFPLQTIECEEVTQAVKDIGVAVLGGKGSKAYNNSSIRSKVYIDIHKQLKREFDVKSYKAIKRKYLESAIRIIKNYKPPFILDDEISIKNKQLTFREV